MFQRGDTLLSKYIVEHLLGQGGMGTVLGARHIELDQLFAIKLMHQGAVQSETMHTRFVREARAAAHLKSPHIARVYDVGRLRTGEPYMVMEYLHGCNLRALITRLGPLPYEHAALLIRQACEGIAEAHAQGIIHRDLKLDNLFLTHLRDGRPCLKILDFGISKYANESKDLTNTGAMLGSLRYMSPEQLRNAKNVDARADVWAMGTIFYELLTDCAAFCGDNIATILDNVLESEPQPLSELCPGIPAALEEAIMRCLAKQPEQRYQSIDELAAVVSNALPPSLTWPQIYVEAANILAEQLAGTDDQGNEALGAHSVASTEEQLPERPQRAPLGRALVTTQPSTFNALAIDKVPLVCISYQSDVRADVEVAKGLEAALSSLGLRTFLPASNSDRGAQAWVEQVTRAIHDCDVFVVLTNEQAAVSELVVSQLALARELNVKAPGRPQLLSVRVVRAKSAADATAPPAALEALRHVEWAGPQDTMAVMSAIVERLGIELPAGLEANLPAWAEAGVSAAPVVRAAKVPLEQPGGIVQATSPFYVANPKIERRCQEELRKPGALVRVKSPQWMGKSSLIGRLLDDVASAGMRIAHVDLKLADSNILSDLDRFLRWICAVISRRLGLPRASIEWDDVFGPKDNCTAYFEEHFFGSGKPLVLALKNIDRLFGVRDVAEEFMILLRAWHEMTKSSPQWQELRMILSYSTEMYMPLDVNHSPFNVGLAISLTDWDSQTVLELARRHGLAWGSDEVTKLMHLIGGHPHLVRIALYHLAETGRSLDDVLAKAASDEGLFADHVRHLLWHLNRQPALAHAAAQVMHASRPLRLPTELAFKLVSLGVVQMRGDLVSPGRELYRLYLSSRLDPGASLPNGTSI